MLGRTNNQSEGSRENGRSIDNATENKGLIETRWRAINIEWKRDQNTTASDRYVCVCIESEVTTFENPEQVLLI